MGVSTGAVGKQVLALLTVQFGGRRGEVQVLLVRIVSARDGVAVVLVTADEYVFTRVYPHNLLFFYAEFHAAS